MPRRQIDIQTTPGAFPLTWPMGLTMLRLLLLPVFLYLLLSEAENPGLSAADRYGAIAIFAVMAATDKLDGYLARRLNQTSRLGQLLDPVADKLLIASSVVLLNFEHIAPVGFRIPLWVVIPIYGKDLVVAIGSVVLLYLVGRVSITPRWLGKASTALQLALVLATLLGPELARISPAFAGGFVRFLWSIVVLCAVLSTIDYVLEGIRQLRRAKSGELP